MRPPVAALDYAGWQPPQTPTPNILVLYSPRQFSFFKIHKVFKDSKRASDETSHTLPSPPMCLQSPVSPPQSRHPKQEDPSVVSAALWWSHAIVQGRQGRS